MISEFSRVVQVLPAADGGSVCLITNAPGSGRLRRFHVFRVTFGERGGIDLIGNELPKALAVQVASRPAERDGLPLL